MIEGTQQLGGNPRSIGARWFPALGVATVAVLLLSIFFLRDGYVRANGVLVALGSLTCLLSLVARPFPRLDLKRVWPYLAYLTALTVSLILSRNAEAWWEYGRQLTFLGLVLAVAHIAAPPWRARVLVTLLIVSSLLVLLSAIGFGAWSDSPQRLAFYGSVWQWSGYPELGLLAAMGAAGCLAVVAVGRRPVLRVAATLLFGFFLLAALVLYSRSSWVTIGVVAVWIGGVSLVRWRRWKGTLVIVILVIVAGGIALGSPLMRRYLSTFSSAAGSLEVAIRTRGWEAAAAMIKDHPLFGVGPGNYQVAYPGYASGADRAHAYNLLFHTGADIGLVGLACYLAMWARVLALSFRGAGTDAQGLMALAVHAMLVAFFVRSQSEHFLANLPTSLRLLLLLAVLFGLAEARACPGSPKRSSLGHSRRSGA